MPNQYVNKVVVNGVTKLDLTGDTVAPQYILKNYTAHDKSGAQITGSCTFDADTSDATANAAEMLSGQTAYVSGQKVTGSMVNNGALTRNITTKTQTVSIPVGYHDGGGSVQISSTEQSKIVAGNIMQGVTILGVTGTLSPASGVTAQSKNATPTFTTQTITPDESYNYLSQVTIAAIPVTEIDNASGGKTLTIG